GPRFTLSTPLPGDTGTFTAERATLAPGAGARFRLVVMVDPNLEVVEGETFISNTAMVTSTTPDPDLDNNSNTTNTPVVTSLEADLALTKAVSNPRPLFGSLVTFTLLLRNLGPDPATNIVVRDPLPPGVTFVTASATRGSYNPA